MFDPIEFLQQTVNFLILVFLLHRLLYKPVRNFLDQRATSIEEQIKCADADRAEAEKLRIELEARLAESMQEAKSYMDNAIKRSEQMHEELIAQAKLETEQIKERARQDIQQEKEKAWAEMKDGVVNLAFTMASKVVQESLDEQKHTKLVQDIVGKLDKEQLGGQL